MTPAASAGHIPADAYQEAPHSTPRCAVRTLAAVSTAVLDELGIESAHVLRASFGGAVAQQVAIYHPSRLGEVAGTIFGGQVAVPESGGGVIYQNEMTWRIRLTLPDDPHGRALLDEALSDYPVNGVRQVPRSAAQAEITGEVMIELAQGESLGILLGALHIISPAGLRDPHRPAGDDPRAPCLTPAAAASRNNLVGV